MSQPLLQTCDLSRRYGPVTVLDRVSLDVRPAEVHALVGANGAGKSTLCKIIAGLIPATAGKMTFEGEPYAPAAKQAAEAAGVQIVQQELNLIPTLTVGENVMLGRIPQRLGIIRHRDLQRRARHALDRCGLADVPVSTLVSKLGVGRQQMVEIAAALDRDCRLLILDEPTAALSGSEVERLFEWLGRLRGSGVGVLYISHRLEEVTRLADRVTVLRDGKRIATHAASELSSDAMVELMSGEVTGTSARHTHRSHAGERTVLSVRGLARGSAVREASFEVRGGERLGITGLVGSGRTELLRALFGADRAKTGEVRVGDDAKPRRFAHPSQAVAAGLAMVTEDRKANGLLLSQPIRVNATLCALSRSFARFGLILSRAERSATDRMRQRLQIHCTGIQQRTGTLSGGNQQKVVVAKWLVRDAEVFLFDEPTRGIDVAARRKIYGIIEELAARGKGIVIVSSDLEELLETCDRIAVISAGRIAATFDRGEWSRDRITRAAFSGYVQAEPGPSR